MFTRFFYALREAQVPVSLTEYLTLLEAVKAGLAALVGRRFLLPVTRRAGQGRAPSRPFRPGVRSCLPGAGGARRPARQGVAGGVAAQARRVEPHARGDGQDRGAGRLGQADGDAAPAPGGAEGASPGRLEVDRHRRHVAVRRPRLQSRGRADRPGRQPQLPGGQGLGQARVPQPRRHGRARHPQHQGGAAQAAQIRPPGAARTNWISTARSGAPPRTAAGSTCGCRPSGETS